MIGKQQKHRQPLCTVSAQVGYQVTNYLRIKERKKKKKELTNAQKVFINKLF